MFIFPSIIALIVGFIGLRFGSDSPESYGLGKAEELFGEEISEEDKETEENEMTKWQIFVEYVLKNKVIWLLCFSISSCMWYVLVSTSGQPSTPSRN